MLGFIIIAYIIVIGLFLVCVAIAVTEWQRRNRSEMRRLERELDRLVGRLKEPEGGPR